MSGTDTASFYWPRPVPSPAYTQSSAMTSSMVAFGGYIPLRGSKAFQIIQVVQATASCFPGSFTPRSPSLPESRQFPYHAMPPPIATSLNTLFFTWLTCPHHPLVLMQPCHYLQEASGDPLDWCEAVIYFPSIQYLSFFKLITLVEKCKFNVCRPSGRGPMRAGTLRTCSSPQPQVLAQCLAPSKYPATGQACTEHLNSSPTLAPFTLGDPGVTGFLRSRGWDEDPWAGNLLGTEGRESGLHRGRS